MKRNIDDILMKYVLKFNESPPLLYGMDYDDEPIIKVIEKAIETGEKLTLDSYGFEGEGVITH